MKCIMKWRRKKDGDYEFVVRRVSNERAARLTRRVLTYHRDGTPDRYNPDPWFYTQKRVWKHQNPANPKRFRSMVHPNGITDEELFA